MANWSVELKAMNEAKEGARFRYPELFVKLFAVVHAYVPPYRQLGRLHQSLKPAR